MLSEIQAAVAEFHRATGYYDRAGKSPMMIDSDLRSDLMAEELGEIDDAICDGNLPAAVDGLGDLIYVCVGTALRWGVDLSPIMEAIHRANMAKVGGPVREDGKRLKPAGWTPPDIAALLRAQGWDGK